MIKLATSIQTLNHQEERAIQTFIAQLNKHFGEAVSNILLYGSKARGDDRMDSDVDLLIVMESDDWTVRNRVSDIASRISLEFDLLISPHVVSQRNWQEMSEAPLSFYKNVIQESIPLLLTEN